MNLYIRLGRANLNVSMEENSAHGSKAKQNPTKNLFILAVVVMVSHRCVQNVIMPSTPKWKISLFYEII